MRLRCCSFEKMADEVIRSNKKILMFGAGAVGLVTVPQILYQYQLTGYVDCFLDNDPKKWKTAIEIGVHKYKIHPVEYLKKCDKNSVIFINISRYWEALRQLESIECTKDMSSYIMPMMCIYNFCGSGTQGNAVLIKKPLIPKKIHYMWLGKRPLPLHLERCIDTWKKYCPDYEIIQWDESNYDLNKNLYMRQAYENGVYGFVPDYARLDILYRYGGIYMDTDVELLKPLDPLLYQEAFCGVEKWQLVNFGGCSGSVAGQRAVKAFLDERESLAFINPNGTYNWNTCGYYDTRTAIEHGYKINGKSQNILGMNIYSSDYFHPYDYMSGKIELTERTFSVHWFNGGWLNEEMRQENRKTSDQFEKVYREALENGLGI